MKFGEKLKQLRQEQNWTQPELAEKLGIEQSWLSKIENDKSTPSGELLESVARVFGVPIESILADLDADYLNGGLGALPQVRAKLQKRRYDIIHQSRAWIIGSVLSLALGATAVAAGTMQLFFPEQLYTYESKGVIYPGEPEMLLNSNVSRIFRSLKGHGLAVYPSEELNFNHSYETFEGELDLRRDTETQLLYRYQGQQYQEAVAVPADATDVFGQPVPAGSNGLRVYMLAHSEATSHIGNSLLTMAGTFLAVIGLLGFLAEYRFSTLMTKLS